MPTQNDKRDESDPATLDQTLARADARPAENYENGTDFRSSTIVYMLMMSYISPLATACCIVATPSLRLAFSV
jgi:hypothetical protein